MSESTDGGDSGVAGDVVLTAKTPSGSPRTQIYQSRPRPFLLSRDDGERHCLAQGILVMCYASTIYWNRVRQAGTCNRALPGSSIASAGILQLRFYAASRFRRLSLGHGEAKYGTGIGIVVRPQPAAMRFDDRVADRQSHPHAGALRCDEWLKQFCPHLGRQARAAVRDAELDHVIGRRQRCDNQGLLWAAGHRLDRIPDQVEQDLLDLHLVDESHGRLWFRPRFTANP